MKLYLDILLYCTQIRFISVIFIRVYTQKYN